MMNVFGDKFVIKNLGYFNISHMIIAMMHCFVMRFVVNFNRSLDVSNLGLVLSILWHKMSNTRFSVMWSLNIVRSSLNVMRLVD